MSSHDNCNGCILSIHPHICTTKLNDDGSCPCTVCIVKMMKCDNTSMNYSCDMWMSWFSVQFCNFKGIQLEEFDDWDRDYFPTK